jgi:hypothetical protein
MGKMRPNVAFLPAGNAASRSRENAYVLWPNSATARALWVRCGGPLARISALGQLLATVELGAEQLGAGDVRVGEIRAAQVRTAQVRAP